MSEVEYLEWFGAYQDKWTPADLNDEAFSHPAKMSKGLLLRILAHAVEKGYMIPGQTMILDPFGGQMSTAWGALKYGNPCILIELEQYFFDIGAGVDCTGVSIDYPRLMLRAKKAAYKDRHLCPACIVQLGKITEPKEAIEAKKRWDARVLPLRQRFQKARARLNHYKALAVKEYYERKGLGKPSRLALKREPMLMQPISFPELYTPPVKQPDLLDLARPESLIYQRNSGKQPRRSPHHYQGNIERWVKVFGGPAPIVLRGNSMELASLVEGVGLSVSSPPYGQSLKPETEEQTRRKQERIALSKSYYDGRQIESESAGKAGMGGGYGSTPAQLGAMSLGSPTFGPTLGSDDPDRRGGLYRDGKRRGDKNLTAEYGESEGQMGLMTLGSPPYASLSVGQTGEGPGVAGNAAQRSRIEEGAITERAAKAIGVGYGDNEDNLSILSLGSPSWAGNSGGQTEAARNGIDPGVFDRHQGGMNGGVGQTEGNIGAMPMVGISSPPFVNNLSDHPSESIVKGGLKMGQSSMGNGYGNTPDQLGNASPQTFWQASETIIRQMAQVMPPGSISIWVTGDFITNGQRYEFSRLWAELCEWCGFELVEWVKAYKVSEVAKAVRLEGGHKTIKKGGVSFFRNLQNEAARQNGKTDLIVEHEDVLILKKI